MRQRGLVENSGNKKNTILIREMEDEKRVE